MALDSAESGPTQLEPGASFLTPTGEKDWHTLPLSRGNAWEVKKCTEVPWNGRR